MGVTHFALCSVGGTCCGAIAVEQHAQRCERGRGETAAERVGRSRGRGARSGRG